MVYGSDGYTAEGGAEAKVVYHLKFLGFLRRMGIK